MEHIGASSTDLLTRGLVWASPMPVTPSSVWIRISSTDWHPSPIRCTSGNRSMMPSVSVILITILNESVTARLLLVKLAATAPGSSAPDDHRRPPMRFGLRLVALVVLGLLPLLRSGAVQAQTPRRGGDLVIGINSPIPLLDIMGTTDDVGRIINLHLYEALVTRNEKLEPAA